MNPQNTENQPQPSIMPQQPTVFTPPVSNTAPLPPKKTKKKLIIAIVAALTLLIAGSIATLFLYVLPKEHTKEFSTKSDKILHTLSETMAKLHDDNFMAAKKVTSDFNEAKKLLAQRMDQFDDAADTVDELKQDYNALKPTSKNADEKQKADKAFELARNIIDAYGSSLDFRQDTFTAFGDVPNLLQEYVEAYTKGTYRSDIIAQAKTIASSADAALIKMNRITAGEADQTQYKLRVEDLTDTKDTFTKLAQYYTDHQDQKADDEITAYSARNDERNKKIVQTIDTYLTDSTIAKDFDALANLIGSPKANDKPVSKT